MESEIRALQFFPVTTTKAIFIDGTNKTLQQAIENGELGTVTTANNFVTNAYFYVNDMIFKKNFNNDITILLNKKLTLNRIMVVCYSSGAASNVSFTDGTIIPNGKTLIWDTVNNFRIVDTVSVPYNGVLVGTNQDGRITAGILTPIWDKYNKYTHVAFFKSTYNVHMTEIPRMNSRTLHSMFVCNDELITLECYNGADFNGASHVYSLPDLKYKSTFTCQLRDTNTDGSIVNLRLVTCDYDTKADTLIMGNGTADGSEEGLYGYIFYGAKDWKNYTEPVTFEHCGGFTKLDFFTEGLFPGQGTAKIVWSELPDICYLTTSNLKYCHKILLGVDTNKLSHGFYAYDATKRYNGTYEIIKTYQQETPEVGNKDVQFYKGAFYYSVKFVTGGLKIYKSYLTEQGTIESDLIYYNPITPQNKPAITGSPEGLVVYKDKIIASHATYGKFYVADFI